MSRKTKLVSSLVAFILILDQATKIAVDRAMPLNHSIAVIGNFFNLTYIRNTGAAFGLLAAAESSIRLPFLVVFSVLAIAFILVLIRRLPESEKALTVALAFILGGAVGNLIDRVLYGAVIDFFDFYWSSYHWPAFNFADSFITVGVVIALFRLSTSKGRDPFSRSGR